MKPNLPGSKIHELQRSKLQQASVEYVRSDALFKTVRSALSFAYAIVHFPIASSPKLGPSIGCSGRFSGMSPQEKHAQGALIRKAAEERLSGTDLAMTFALYGAGKLKAFAIEEVVNEVSTMIRKTGLGNELVRRYFAHTANQKSQEQLGREYGLSRQRITQLERMVVNQLEILRISAESKLESMFVRSGISEAL